MAGLMKRSCVLKFQEWTMMRNTLLLTASAMINSIVSTQCSSGPSPLVLLACPVFRSFLCAPPARWLSYHQYWHDWTALSKDQHCWLARWLTLNTHLSRLLTYDLAVFGESKEACCRVKADMLQHLNWSIPVEAGYHSQMLSLSSPD